MSTIQDTNLNSTTVAPSQAVMEKIAALEDIDSTELDPLSEVFNPEALNALVETNGQSEAPLRVEFIYSGYYVSVDSDGIVYVDEAVDLKE
ncbi:HalOD1 output domain-containing protein [Haloprofundus salinisoli]|uniref:HalOD1 output domain-containing protein n=1 Tax=Haloprofundus salinisoli TaxID=2876193 RepID=UPI001CC8EFE1|nr:HalOD1 output domain-containing protein [Haloprofundus salinisoli]